MKAINLTLLVLFSVFLYSCGLLGDDKEKNSLEKEKIELEKKKLELERAKLESSDGSDENDSEKLPESKPEKKSKSVDQPSVGEQKEVIYNFYRDFDNAFDQGSMKSYIDEYYGAGIKSTYMKNELPSYSYYNSKEHDIDDITLISETDETRKYKVIFYFTFERSNGTTGSNKCADILTLDNNNIVIARSELGKVK